ncbi:MAG: 2-phosphosulfolactate phosphatase [Candidatus Dormibacteraceae bacterium]
MAHDLHVEVIHATGIDGARQARGIAIVIDVLRAFTVSAYAIAGGARECRLVIDTSQALALAKTIPGAIVSAEEEGLPIPGIAISNSPTQIKAAAINKRVLVQRSSAGTQVAAAVPKEVDMFAASLVVARATVQACLLRRPSPAQITLVASADDPEDHACGLYMAAIIRGATPDINQLLQPLRESERYARLTSGAWPGFPATDLELALKPDRFDFAMPAKREAGYISLTRADQPNAKG